MFENEVAWMDAFNPYMAVFLKQEEDDIKEADRKFRALATVQVYEEFLHISTDNSATFISQLESKINQKADKLKSEGEINVAPMNISENVHTEILWAAGKRMVRIRSKKIKNHNRWFNRKQVQQQINADNNKANKEVKKIAKSVEIKLFEKKFWSKEDSLNEEFEELNKKCNAKFFESNEYVNSSVEAKFLRYATEGVTNAQLDWSKNKEIKVGAKASGSYSLAEGTGDFTVHLPNQYGFGLMQYSKAMTPLAIDDDYIEIFLKIVIGLNGSAFVGACASVSADLGMTMKEGKKGAGAEAGLDLFVGAKAEAKATFEIQMMFVDDATMDLYRKQIKTVGERGEKLVSSEKIEKDGIAKWESLGGAEIGAFAAVGAGVSAVLAVEYYKGKLRYQAKIALVVKVGGGKFMKGVVDVPLIGKFIFTIANNLNWKNISDAFDKQTQLFYHTVMNNCFYLKRNVDEVYGELKDDFKKIMEFLGTNLDGFVEAGLEQFKIIDDKLDEIIPGYKSYKQYNMRFIVLKSAYVAYKSLQQKNNAIYTVLNSKGDHQRWQYATWQMKVNLIYDMRKGLTDYADNYSDRERGDAVLTVLETARNKAEFGKIIDGLKAPLADFAREKIEIKDLLVDEQKPRLKALNMKYKYMG